jgi:regulator of protease activity HflC (stomatin/prohibitin superfamily)
MSIVKIKNGLINVNEFERGVRFRFGKLSGVIESGLHLAVPGISELRLVDMRPQIYETSIEVFGKDKYPIVLPLAMIYRVENAEKVIVKSPENFEKQVGILFNSKLGLQSYARKSLEEIFLSRDKLETEAYEIMKDFLMDWGFTIDAIKIKQPTTPQVFQLGRELYETEMRQIIEPLKAEIERKVIIIKAEASAQAYKTQFEPRLEAFNKYFEAITKAAGEIAEKYKTDARDVMYILFSNNLGAEHPITKKIFTKMGMEGLAEGAKSAADIIGTGATMPYLVESLKGMGMNGLYIMNVGDISQLAELDKQITKSNFPE